MSDLWILTHGKDCIPYEKYENIEDAIKRYYHFSGPGFWMWKMFQFGFVYGIRAERARRKRAAEKNTVNSMCIQISEQCLV